MKRIVFSRKAILRAIHAACVALYFAAIAAAHAQTATGDGNGNVTITGSGTTPFTLGPSSSPPLAAGGTLTIAAGASTSTSAYSPGSIQIQVNTVGTTTNSGEVESVNPGGPETAIGLDYTSVSTAGNVTVQNNISGTISASAYSVSTSAPVGTVSGISVQNVTHGSISITNNGLIEATGLFANDSPGYAPIISGIYANDTYASGTITLANTGTISASYGDTNSAYGAYLTTSGSGGITVSNSSSGSITAQAGLSGTSAGFDLISSGSGAISATNDGTITASNVGGDAYGIDATSSGSGSVMIQNSGAVTSSGSNYGTGDSILATAGTGSLTVTNSGYLTASGYTTAGIAANGAGAVSVTNTSSGTMQVSGVAVSGISASSTNGNAYVNNAAALTVSGRYTSSAIYISGATATLTNSGTLSSQGRDIAPTLGINAASTSGTLMVTNSGAISASGNYVSATDILLQGTGDTTLITTGTQVLTATAHYNDARTALGESVNSSAGTVTVANQQTLSINGDSATAIQGVSQLGTSIANTGSVSVSGYFTTYGVEASAATGNVSATNSGSIMSSSNYGTAYGVSGGVTTSGNVSLTNNGPVVVNSSGGNAYGLNADSSAGAGTVLINNASGATVSATASGSGAYGIRAISNTGSIEIDNGGATSGSSTYGLGYGIYANSNGPIVVNNTGTATGSTYGIYLASAGTVNNYGSASGGTYSIDVPTASTVNLEGTSSVSGLIKGGVNDTSTSQLNFHLTVPSSQAAADKTALNAAIASYDAAYATANGNGSNVDSEVVTINGVNYQWEDFAGVSDELTVRLYRNIPGFYSEGLVLDNLPNNATSNTLINALNNLPDADVAAALSELSPQQLEVFRNVAFDNNTFNVAKINNHLANRRDGETGFDSSQLTVHDPSMDGTLDQVRSHLLAYNNPASSLGPVSDSAQAMFGAMDMKDMKSTEVNSMPSDPWSTFIAGDVLLANLSNSTTQQNSNYTTGSVTAGADYRLDDHFTVGALFSYAHTDANLDTRGSSATVDSYTPGIYASYVNKGWYANFLGAYSRNAYTSDRMVDIPGLNGDNHGGTHGNQGSVNLTGGYEFQKGAFKFGPIASLQYVHLEVDAMQEQGPTALSINSQDQDSLRSQLGFEGRFVANVNTPLGPMTLTPHLSASWQHEYMDSSGGITSQFTGTGGGSFVTQTQPPDRDAAFVDVGLDATVDTNVTLFVDYETQAGQQNYFAQSAQAGVKIGF